MKVYTAVKGYAYEGEDLLGLFSTLEVAKASLENLGDYQCITEWQQDIAAPSGWSVSRYWERDFPSSDEAEWKVKEL